MIYCSSDPELCLIAKQHIQVVSGENALALNGISNLPSGVYNVQLIADNTLHYTINRSEIKWCEL